MRVIESFILGKKTDQLLCEDRLFVNSNFIAVIDGATSVSGKNYDGKATGFIAAELAFEVLSEIDPQDNAYIVLNYINNSINDFYVKHNIDADSNERFSLSLVIYSSYYNQIWRVGDCSILIDNVQVKSTKKVDELIAEVRSFILNSYLNSGYTVEDIRKDDLSSEVVSKLIMAQYNYQNRETENSYNYFVIDGRPIDTKNIEVINLDNTVKEIVFSSDGYPKVYNTLFESEKYLKKILEEDPLMIFLHKSVKGYKIGDNSFDDRVYIRFLL